MALRIIWKIVPPKLVTLIVAACLWQVVSMINEYYPFYNATLVPSPARLLTQGYALVASGELFYHMWASILRILAGLALAIPTAVLVALVVTGSRAGDITLDPLVELLRPVPSLALLPLFIVWFGIGELTKVVFIAFSAFFVVYVTTVEAIRNVDPILYQSAGSLGFKRWHTFMHVTLKSTLPQIMVGIRIALASSWFLIVGAEFLAANEGLGFLINFSRVWFQIDKMMVAAAVIGILGLVSNYLLLELEKRLFVWRDR